MEAVPILKCNLCNSEDFSTRNKLYKHLNLCVLKNKNEFQILSEVDFKNKYNAFIYVTGGRLRGQTLGSAERYSFKNNTWESCPSMLENRGSHGSGSVNEILYVIGGGGFDSNLSSCEKFDCKTQIWSPIAPMPTSRHALVVLSTGSCIYAVGGWINGSVCSADLEKYDTEKDTWVQCKPMSVPRRLLGVTEYDGKIYAFGGNCDDGVWYTDALEIYDPNQDVWSLGKKMPLAGQTSAITVGQYIYVFIHGYHVYQYCPKSDSYIKISDLPLKQWYCFDVKTVNGRIYVTGGACEGQWTNSMYQFDVGSFEWTEMPKMNKERRRCSAAVIIYN